MKCATAVAILLLAGMLRAQSPSGLDRARELFAGGKLAEAADAYTAVTVVHPTVADAHAGLIRSRLELHDLTNAVKAARDALTTLPQSAKAVAAAGDVEFRIAKFSEALLLYTRATELDPRFARAWWGLGRVYDLTSLRKKAREHFEKAYQLDPTDADIVRDWAYTRSTPGEIATGLEEFLKLATFRAPQHLAETRRQIAGYRYLGNRQHCKASGPPVPTTLSFATYSASSSIPLMGGIGTSISVNGVKPTDFALTSESNQIAIRSSLAERAQVVRIADMPENGRKNYVGFVESMRLGNIEFRNCIVRVLDGPNVTGSRDGTIGLDIFSDYLTRVDFTKKSVSLEPLQPLAAGEDGRWQDQVVDAGRQDFVRALRIGPQFLVNTTLNATGPELFCLCIEDIFVVLSPYLGKQILRNNAREINVTIDRFTVKADAFTNTVPRPPDPSGTEVAGHLGRSALRHFAITFDMRNGLIKFEQ